MPERNAQRFQLATGNLGQVGGYNPTRVAPERAEVETSLGAQALGGLLRLGGQLAEEKFQSDVKEAYMQGQRARMLGQALADEEADIAARPFVRGGYEDQDFRIQQATLQLEMEQFIAGKGRELPPEEFVQQLAARARPVLEGMEGRLSQVGREQALAQQIALEEALVQKHATANRNWSVEQAAKAYTIDGNRIGLALARARQDYDDVEYRLASEQAALYLHGLQTDGKLVDPTLREDVQVGFLRSLLSPGNDNHELVRNLLEANGSPLESMAPDKRAQVYGWIEDAEKRTRSGDLLGSYQTLAAFDQRNADGLVGDLSEVHRMAVWMQENNFSAADIMSRYKTFYSSTANAPRTSQVIGAFQSGNRQELFNLNSDPAEASGLLWKMAQQQQVPIEQAVTAVTTAGLRFGHVSKEAATEFTNSLNAFLAAPDQPADPAVASILQAYLGTVRSVDGDAAELLLTGAVSRNLQPVVQGALLDMRAGRDPLTALRTAAERQSAVGRLDEAGKSIRREALRTEVVDQLAPGKFTQLLRAVDPSSTRYAVDGPAAAQLQGAVMLEAQMLLRLPEYLGADAEVISKIALGNVSRRLVDVPSDAGRTEQVLLPEPIVTLLRQQRLDDNPVRVGQALAAMYPAQAEWKPRFLVDGGILSVAMQREDGTMRAPRPVPAEALASKVAELRDAAVRGDLEPIIGKPVTKDGVTLRLDGANSAGLSGKVALQAREWLVQDEGVRLQAYADKDASGTQVGVATGVGFNVTGQQAEGQGTTPEAVAQEFKARSDAAFVAARKVARDWGIPADKEQQIAAMATAMYQMGPGGLEDFKDAKAAYQARDLAGFESAIRNSKWYKQTPERVEKFLQRFKQPSGPGASYMTVDPHWMQ